MSQPKNAPKPPPSVSIVYFYRSQASFEVLSLLHPFLLTPIYLAYRAIDKIYY